MLPGETQELSLGDYLKDQNRNSMNTNVFDHFVDTTYMRIYLAIYKKLVLNISIL